MQIRALALLVVAVVLGGLTVFMVNSYLQREVERRDVVEEIRTVPIVVARSDIEPGARLTEAMLNVVNWPEAVLPENYFSSIRSVLPPDVKAPVVLRETRKGEPILKYILSPYGARGGLPTKIPEDMRGITISVNEVRGVAGFVLPGDYVDVLHTTRAGRLDDQIVTRIVLQNAKVIGVDQVSSTAEADPKVARVVTLLVSPFDGQRLVLASSLGELTLMLRNEFDASLVEELAATFRHLIAVERDRPVTVVTRRERRDPVVEIIRGLEVLKETVPEDQQAQ